MTNRQSLPIKSFSTRSEWGQWLLKNYSRSNGIWLQIFKKYSGKKSITYDEAVDEALCFGWIDGQKDRYDETSWLQKFTPRRPKSLWSRRNKQHVVRLIKEKRMHLSGLKEVEAAKTDGRWNQAYDSPRNMEIPADFLQELMKNRTAHEFFKTLNKANTYAIVWRLQTAKKPETRERRMKAILDMLLNRTKIH
jgi:uncharacterized protein YdeI (YjbR/CyaY-like superfamily)